MQKFTTSQLFNFFSGNGENDHQVDQLIETAVSQDLIREVVTDSDFNSTDPTMSWDVVVELMDLVLDCKDDGFQILTASGQRCGLKNKTDVVIVAYSDKDIEINC